MEMEKTIAENIAKVITDAFKDMAKTETVIGKEFKAGECTIIPVIKVSMGFGTGGGAESKENKKSGSGGGGGGGLTIEPIAFLVICGKEVHLLNVGKKDSLTTLLDHIPGIVDKTAEALKDFKKGSDEEEEEE